MKLAFAVGEVLEPSTSLIEPTKYQAIILGNIIVPLKRSLLSPEGFKLSSDYIADERWVLPDIQLLIVDIIIARPVKYI